jgi:DNA polymerase-3 subunit delta'
MSLALFLAALLRETQAESIAAHPYTKIITMADTSAGGIDAMRELEHFLSLKVPGNRAVSRLVIVEDSHLLSVQAQNAVLKTLEEPPTGTVLILTASEGQALLPTIMSRAQHIALRRPPIEALRHYFESEGYPAAAIQQAFAMSGGLPGLTHALLSNVEHPLLPATAKARELLALSMYDRLAQVDSISKQKELCRDILYILQQMAHVSLRSAEGQVAKQWQKILTSGYEATDQLISNGQTKLVMMNFFLNI